jgi:23S rRNA (uridine2552-2'-O)-methyltransferase
MAKKGKRPKRPQDHYGERAKKEGLPARSYYKLEEMDKKHRILSRGAKVLDLGCSPGSWTMYCARRVGSDGFVWGVDLKPVDQVLPANAEAVVGDAYEWDPPVAERGLDVVLSDMAPATTGNRVTDGLRSAGLVERALDVAEAKLRPGGHFCAKLLESGEVEVLMKRMRTRFKKVARARPDATRKQSTEVFLIGLGLKISTLDEPSGENT